MRSDDEDNDDFEEDDDDDDADKDLFGDDQYDGDGDVDVDVDGDDGDEDEDEDDDDDGGGDDDEDEDDEDEDDDEDDDDDDGKEDDEDEAVESTAPPTATPAPPKSKSASPEPAHPTAQPPHLLRRALFIPGFTSPPASLSVEAIVGIPLPSAVHCLSATTCMSYLLAGSQDGYVRVYDLWASVNGGQVMTAQQRAVVGLGEGVSKAGVGRGWWAVDTPVTGAEAVNGAANGQAAAPARKQEPVYSLACQGDGLWTLAGTLSGPINLYSLRHQPGHLVHSLTGHTSVVSALELLPGETSLLSGSWDGTVKEWDLNTGQETRSYPTSGAQISTIGMRPTNVAVTVPEAAFNVNVGPDFFKADREKENGVKKEKDADGDAKMEEADGEADADADGEADADADGEADDAASMGSLFGDDADGEEDGDATMAEPTPTPAVALPTPTPAPAPAPTPLLALPGTSKPTPPVSASPAKPKPFTVPVPAPPRPGPARGMPLLSPAEFRGLSNDVLLTASMNGQVTLVDRRVGGAIGRLQPGDKVPPWCMSAVWSGDGNQVLAGRRNGMIDIWDTRMASQHAPGLLRTLRTPPDSGPISCLVAFPDGRHVASASTDNIRLWNTADYYDPAKAEALANRSRPPFRIITGHHGGTVSSMIVDPTCRFLVSASGDRGWQGEATKVVLVHEIKYS